VCSFNIQFTVVIFDLFKITTQKLRKSYRLLVSNRRKNKQIYSLLSLENWLSKTITPTFIRIPIKIPQTDIKQLYEIKPINVYQKIIKIIEEKILSK
jgi:hypothetical protein